MATLKTKRKDKNGATRYRAEVYVNGVRDSKWCENQREAKSWAARRETEIRDGAQKAEANAAKLTLGNAMNLYRCAEILKLFDKETKNELIERPKKDEKEPDKPIPEFTMQPLRRTLRSSIAEFLRVEKMRDDPICKIVLSKLTRADVREWQARRISVAKPSTVDRERTIFASCIEYWRDEDDGRGLKLPENVFHRQRKRRRRTNQTIKQDHDHIFSENEIHEIRAAFCTRRRWLDLVIMFEVARETGLRMAELVAIEWRDVDEIVLRVERVDDVGGVSVEGTKSGKTRIVPLTLHALEMLAEKPHGKPNERVFRVSYDALKKARQRAFSLAGVDARWHDLRHHAITAVDDALGGDVTAVKDFAGHATPMMTSAYTHRQAETIARRLQQVKKAA